MSHQRVATAIVAVLTAIVAAIAASVVAIAGFPAIVTTFGIPVAPIVVASLLLCREKHGDVANHVTNVALPGGKCHTRQSYSNPIGHVPSIVEPLHRRNMKSELEI